MGDVSRLVEKAQDIYDEKEAKELERKFAKMNLPRGFP